MPSGTRPAASALSLSPNSSNAAAPTGGPRRRAPSRDRGLGEPDRQAAATAQAGVVRRPIRDPMTLLRNMVTAVIEALERQRAILDGRGNRQPTSGRRRLAIHATKWRGDVSRHTGGDLRAALGRIKAKTFVMPMSSDMFFPPADCQAEWRLIPEAEFRPIQTIDGHLALFGADPNAISQLDKHLSELLATKI